MACKIGAPLSGGLDESELTSSIYSTPELAPSIDIDLSEVGARNTVLVRIRAFANWLGASPTSEVLCMRCQQQP